MTVSEQLSKNVSQRVAIVRGYVLFGEGSFLQDFRRYTETSKALTKKLLELYPGEETKALVARNDEWRAMVEDEVFPSYAAGHLDKALQQLNDKTEPIARELMTEFDRLASSSLEQIDADKQSLIQSLSRNKWIVMVLSAISILLGIGIALGLSNSIIRPIVRIIERIRSIAEGDLQGERIDSGTKDEISKLAEAMNGMVGNLRKIVAKVHENAGHISSSSDGLSASASDMNAATADIAGAVREVASGALKQQGSLNDNSVAMTEMSIVIQRIAEATNNASQVAAEAAEKAGQGQTDIRSAVDQMGSIHHAIGRTSGSMNRLGTRIGEINAILAMLREIAAQTNMLGLNASVEAARAGEAGRGFSVVANEIKKLSDQSANSSKSIAELVKLIHMDTDSVLGEMEESVKAIERGMRLVDRAGATFERIVDSNVNVSADIQEIASAAEQMSASSEQLAASLAELTAIAEQSLRRTRQVADTTDHQLGAMEEITASSSTLRAMAGELRSAVDVFKI
ncbi:methyl-accepting chemotaxis protein [Cohnella terricola]|uniref:HAMP domain-containing protein n=1 Tax=Cohnella terricola TaxID=1289167 RepID=A0A559JC32_9BACL|nr:HAMP domain-containing methyl-accepting chemotaxis protein [Cohnella terricola]TVX97421.1 HAMP domain-containing protein [Cohnella terricola]